MKDVNEVGTKEDSHPTVFDSQYGSRQVLDLLAEKWTAHILYALAFGVKLHGEYKREIKGCKSRLSRCCWRTLQTAIQESEASGRIRKKPTKSEHSLPDEEEHDVSQTTRSWPYS
jgi:DNA-binding HxlR family transcriptional regulator